MEIRRSLLEILPESVGGPLQLTFAKSIFIAILSISASLYTVHASELIMFDSPYCTWCSKWEDEIGVIYDLTPESCQAPLRRIDISDDLPDSLIINEEVLYTPTFVLINDNREVARIIGYPGEEFFWAMLHEAIDKQIPEELRLKNTKTCKNS